MRLLFLGDIVGRSGRDAVNAAVPGLRQALGLDAVVVNGENAAHGFGITPGQCEELFGNGVDCLTTGNHVWDQKELVPYAATEPRLLRPLNFVAGTAGHGVTLLQTASGKRLMVVNVILRLFMELSNDPFAALDRVLESRRLGRDADAILVDMHGEATSEKNILGHHLDGRVSVVVGTHTHIPTADARVLPGGTAYQTDAGMCGAYDSVIGMDKAKAVDKFLKRVPTDRLSPASGEATLCGLLVELDPATGLAVRAEAFRQGGILAPAGPLV